MSTRTKTLSLCHSDRSPTDEGGRTEWRNPEVIPATMPHQGVSTRMSGENSLGLNRRMLLFPRISIPRVILNKSDRRRREDAVKNPEVIPTTIPHQGVSTRMSCEDSLTLHRTGNSLGILHFAPDIVGKANSSRRCVQDDKRERDCMSEKDCKGKSLISPSLNSARLRITSEGLPCFLNCAWKIMR